MRTLLLLALVASLAATRPAMSETITDAHGRSVDVADTSRIVSIGGPVTEILYALGLGDKVVGRDTTSVYPPQVTDKPDIGYMRALSAEGVLSLSPTLVLAVEGSGPPDAIELLEGAKVAFVNIPDDPSPQGVAAKIRAVAAAVGEPAGGEALARSVLADFATLEASLAAVKQPARAAFVLSMSGGAPLVGGSRTSAAGVLELAHAQNVFADVTGFKPATPESVLTAAPDVVVTMRSGAHDPQTIAQSPIFAATPAGQSGRVVALDGSYLLGFGPRSAHAVRDLAAALYPEAAIPSLPDRPWTGRE